jgi:hypothetical protein
MGDVATVNVTGGGWTQSWNLRCEQTVQGLAWVTVDYHAARMNANKPLVGH